MKRNRVLGVLAILLMLVIVTTAGVAGTMAKYTTTANSSDGARVAYWGFKDTSLNITDLFSNTYDSVKGGEDVVAPGTAKETTVKFEYTDSGIAAPEVAYNFTVVAEDTSAANAHDALDANPEFKWTLNGTNEYNTLADLITAINAITNNTVIGAGNLPACFDSAAAMSGGDFTIGWKWGFSDGTNDVTDTTMGNAANLDSVSIKITVTATQVD